MTTATPFVEGLIDEIFPQFPFSVRFDMILNWAEKFATEGYIPDPSIVEIIGTITTLDLSNSMKINEKTFPKLVYLPFSPSLAHLDLSHTSVGKYQKCLDTLAHPVFQHLASLNLSSAKVETIDPLLNAPHTFPQLHTLNLSNNSTLSTPTIATTTKFPNLKILDLSEVSDTQTFQGFFSQPQPTVCFDSGRVDDRPDFPAATTAAHFQLEKLLISTPSGSLHFSSQKAPHLSQLRELRLKDSHLTEHEVDQLFNPERNVLMKHLTSLCIGLNIEDDLSVLSALAQSPLLSNLVRLELFCTSSWVDPSKAEINKEFIQQFINSPFLWTNPRLKHLSLKYMPYDFVFDDIIPTLDAANVKLETLDLEGTNLSLSALSAASCLSELKQIKTRDLHELSEIELFIQSPLISNLEIVHFCRDLTPDQLVSMLSSPNMSNDLIEFDLSYYEFPVQDVIKTLCTQRIIPGDESSPLKFAKLRKLYLADTDVSDDDVELIVENLSQLTHLGLGKDSEDTPNPITDKTITALLSTKRADPRYPSPSLPNLVHLDIISHSRITNAGLIQLSQSQLLDQLEYLNVSQGLLLKQDRQTSELPPGLKALLTTPLVSNLKCLDMFDLFTSKLGDLQEQDESLLEYLDHCALQW